MNKDGVHTMLFSLYAVNQSMEVGGLISTCNMIQPGAKQVTVNISHTLLWTMSHKLLMHT